ncbi:MAG: hypothetical protein ABII00_14820 [Elusimicrobiota bacterium]
MRTLRLLMAVGLAGLLGIEEAWGSVGLSSQFVDVVFENLKPGRSYNIREIKGVPYTVKNRGNAPADVIVEAVLPEPTKIVEPYEAIPDPSWISLSPDRMRIDEASMGFSDIIISIPDDPELVGRHFQAMLWAHTVGTGFLAAGVKSRLRFSIGPGPETLERERARKAMVTLNFDLWPTALYVMKAEAGKRYDVKRKEKKTLKLTNRNDETLELVVKAIPWPSSLPPTGYEIIKDLSWVGFKPEKLKVKGNRVKDIRLILTPPEELKGKKVVFVVQLSLPIGTPISATHRVLVTIQ